MYKETITTAKKNKTTAQINTGMKILMKIFSDGIQELVNKNHALQPS